MREVLKSSYFIKIDKQGELQVKLGVQISNFNFMSASSSIV